MQTSGEEKMSPDCNLSLETQMGRALFTKLKISDDKNDDGVKEEENVVLDNNHGGEYEEEEEEEEQEEEFSFICGGANSSPIAAEDAFADGQIKPVFPLFNRELLFPVENLPMRPPVKKVFVEASEDKGHAPSSAAENDGAAGPYCDWSTRKAVEASPEVCKKSNSTGFSKIWRFKDFLGRSNSDGRDAFVFLDNAANQPPSAAAPAEKEVAKKGGKGKKTAAMSAHEVYLKSKAKGGDRRRSYLPYRPELMGFFTNINGGLTKNVHPF